MNDLLQQGIAALRAGRKAEARNLLMQAIRQDERNEMAWLWLSGAVDTDRERRTCLENVLAINPSNEVARRGLESLIAKEGVRPLGAVSSPVTTAEPVAALREQPAQPPVAASTLDLPVSQKRESLLKHKKAARRQTRLTIGLGVAAFMATALIVAVGVWWAIDAGWLQLGPGVPVVTAITQVPSAGTISTATPRPTSIPTWTPRPAPTSVSGLATVATADVPILAEPQIFVLTLAEMPTGFRLVPEDTGPTSNESVAEVRENPEEFLAQLETWGRINGYVAAYEGTGFEVSYVQISVVIMSTSDGAHAYFEYLANEDAQSGGIPVSMPTLADESYAFTYTETDQDGYQWTNYQVTFRKRNVIGGVFTASRWDIEAFDATLNFARILESRISDTPPATIISTLPAQIVTPQPIQTPIPTQTPTPIFIPMEESQTLGPIWDSARDERFTVMVSLTGIRFSSGGEFSRPKQGYVYVIVDVTIENLGPDPVRSIGPYDFQMRDANGALRNSTWVSDADDCRLDLVDLGANGSVSGCIGFEVPAAGKLELIYAPYKYEGLQPGRYLTFTIRP